MKKLIEEVKIAIIGVLSLVGGCYLLGELQEWFISFIEGKDLLMIIGLPIIMFLMFLILSIKSK